MLENGNPVDAKDQTMLAQQNYLIYQQLYLVFCKAISCHMTYWDQVTIKSTAGSKTNAQKLK